MMRLLIYALSTTRRLAQREDGGLSAEYSFLITFIAIVATLGMVSLGPSIADLFEAVGGAVPDTSENPPCPFGGCDP